MKLEHKQRIILAERHYCTACNTKQYAGKMKLVYYPLLKKHFWHCIKCMSIITDNLHLDHNLENRYILELFAGSKSVSHTLHTNFGYRSFTVDIEQRFTPDLCTDISKMRINQVPERKAITIVWASVPCTYFTIMNIKNHWSKITYSHRQYYYIPQSGEARKAIQLLEKTIWIIKQLNPVYYFIENPRGAMRHMPQINFAPYRYEVSYNDFGFDVYKPTDIFSNCPFLALPKVRGAMGRTFAGSITKMKSAFDRSIVPGNLITDIFNQIHTKHKTQ